MRKGIFFSNACSTHSRTPLMLAWLGLSPLGANKANAGLSRARFVSLPGVRGELFESAQVGLLARLPFLEHPLLDTPFQQWSPVKGDGSIQCMSITA